jgi:hypothetical protein
MMPGVMYQCWTIPQTSQFKYYHMKAILVSCFLALSLIVAGQSPKLICPLQDAKEVFEKQPISYGKEFKIILSSASDTAVKAGIDGIVTNVQRDDDGKMLVVFNFRKYYYWYSGISKVKVVEQQKLKKGDLLGIIQPGDKITLRIFDFETPVDPKLYLDCSNL